ncbi:MAG: TetR/AcrR family transcriptional regulator [Candidatus Binatia bacterium]|nr:TetR/AcrR family transcriptional regulator [Candidatus Binatia bacterium]
MPRVVDVKEKRREILSAAVATFVKHGMRGTNLARVAKAAGMGKSSRYHYFSARDAIAEILREGQRAGEFRKGSPDAMAGIVLGGIDGLFLQELIAPGSTAAASRRKLVHDRTESRVLAPPGKK